MTGHDLWRELHRCEDLSEARMLLTCIASMEYDVRLLDGRGTEVVPDDDAEFEAPFTICVPASDAAELNDVLDAIIEEQMEFDVYLAAWHDRAGRWERHLLGLLVALVIILAAFGLIEL